jgi:hypothetical protein
VGARVGTTAVADRGLVGLATAVAVPSGWAEDVAVGEAVARGAVGPGQVAVDVVVARGAVGPGPVAVDVAAPRVGAGRVGDAGVGAPSATARRASSQ